MKEFYIFLQIYPFCIAYRIVRFYLLTDITNPVMDFFIIGRVISLMLQNGQGRVK